MTNIKDSSGALTAKYIYGPNIDEPIRLEKAGQACYYHFDALGSITDLSNSSGQRIEHYTYSPFGKAKIYDSAGRKITDSAYGNCYRFTARQWDPESNLYYYRARMYDPNLGRFLQADPVGYSADINLYRYCSNNPINRVDPRGLEGRTRTGKTGHVTVKNAYISGVPTIIVTFNSGKGGIPAGIPKELLQLYLQYLQSMGSNLPSDGVLYCMEMPIDARANLYDDYIRHQIQQLMRDFWHGAKENVFEPSLNPGPWPDPDKSRIQNFLEGLEQMMLPDGIDLPTKPPWNTPTD